MTENDKREKIIAAAYQVLAEKGYDQASTKEIARAAGVAQGLINYYFPSKDLLFAEVIRAESERYCESLSFLQSKGREKLSEESLKEALEVPKSRAVNDPSWIRLRYELFALGMRNPAVSESLKTTLAGKREHLTRLIGEIAHLPEEQARPLASILHVVFDGLGFQKLSDPAFDYEGAYDTLAAMLDSYLKTLHKS
ncbi:TetR/AcrR family transcriptional regulator [Paenibacillus sp. P26]|nr:TetR/AcrR family transcriptional regulator [Paenibacillus sp. P26]UUZ94740.1 TetR/AcrR family transcriptional regulator [Paenibacillus sp. P25]